MFFLLLFFLCSSQKFLSEEQLKFYQKNGYLVLRNFSTEEEIGKLKTQMNQLIDAWEPDTSAKFSTTDRDAMQEKEDLTKANKFFGSADKIEFFLDQAFLDENGELTRPKHFSINKAGHALHTEDPVFEEFTQNCKIADVAQDLGIEIPTLTQTMYIFKQPFAGEKVPHHVDATFLYTEPEQSCTGFWWAVDESTLENGCLWAIPGSHIGPLKYHWARDDPMTYNLSFINLETGERTMNMENDFDDISEEVGFVPIPMKKGDLMIIHGKIVHGSKTNRSDKERHSYQIHLIDGRQTWSPLNWMQYPKEKTFPTFECLDETKEKKVEL